MGGTRMEPATLGTAVFDDEIPLRYDSNYLLVGELPAEVSYEDVSFEARRLDRHSIMVRHEPTGQRLAPGLERMNWKVHRGVVMAHRRPPQRAVDTSAVEELDEAALRPARRAQMAGQPWATPEVVEQLLEAKRRIRDPVRARFLAVRAGGDVVSFADLYSDRRTGQVEDVGTLDEHRNRGHASAVVTRAVQEARAEGCDLVFLVADADDWPMAWYRTLGFDEIGRYVKFLDES